ncbi:MAG: response regulator transcription factor [Pseudomonadota bacterium]
MRVLVIEDDAETASFIDRGLTEEGYVCDVCASSRDGILAASSNSYDVIVFDRLLPGMDGMDAVRVLRASQIETPILMLTALDGIDDRVAGLEAGADDYMVKPFAFVELHARLRALARRRPWVSDEMVLEAGGITLHRATRSVTRDGVQLDLLPREFEILEILLSNQGQLVTRTMLLDKVWGYAFDPKTSLVQTHVSRLRAKVDKPFDSELIRTVRGSGYMLCADE